MLKQIRKFILKEIKQGKEEYRKQKIIINKDLIETKKVIKESKDEIKKTWNEPYSETKNKE